MSKRKVVKINVELCVQIAKKKHWKAVDLSAMVGKHKNWLSEVKRGRNLPSPEEAARMCAILNVTPEEILLEQADIDMVRGLIESQRTEQEKMPTPEDERIPGYNDLNDTNRKIVDGLIVQLLDAQSSQE